MKYIRYRGFSKKFKYYYKPGLKIDETPLERDPSSGTGNYLKTYKRKIESCFLIET